MVHKKKIDQSGNPMGVSINNPLLDTCIYEVELPDGSVEELSANMISENLFVH